MGREIEAEVVRARVQKNNVRLVVHRRFDIVIHVLSVGTGESFREHLKIGDGFLYVPLLNVLNH